jgi:outer membrane protein assembly factor BamB
MASLAIWVSLSLVSFVVGDPNWSRFRGTNGSGVSSSRVSLPWKEEQMRRIPLEGKGNGSPAVMGSTAFLMSADETTASRYLMAYDIVSGKQLWKKTYESKPHPLHKFSSYASTTPFVDNEHVYFAWADPDHTIVKALRHNGDEVWSRDFGRYVSQHGFGTSPIRVDDSILLLNSQDAQELPPGVEPGYDRMVALDYLTGETRWETKLPTTRVCYGVPCIWEKDGQKQIVCSTTGQGMFGMSVSDGKLLWNHECFTQRVCASSVIVGGDLLIGTQGSGGGKGNKLIAFDLNEKKERYQINKASPYVPCPIFVERYRHSHLC